MKAKLMGLIALFVFSAASVFGGNKSEKVKVSGNCGMCEKRIEKAALAVKGVARADWDKKTKILDLEFDSATTNLDQVEKSVAKAGHDTAKHKAGNAVYGKLPACCQYERKTDK